MLKGGEHGGEPVGFVDAVGVVVEKDVSGGKPSREHFGLVVGGAFGGAVEGQPGVLGQELGADAVWNIAAVDDQDFVGLLGGGGLGGEAVDRVGEALKVGGC